MSVLFDTCPQCGTSVAKSELKHHIENDCPKRTVACTNAANGCEWKGTYENYLSTHKPTCQFEQAAPKKRKRAEKGSRQPKVEIKPKPVTDAGTYDPSSRCFDPKTSDKNVTYINNYFTTRGQAATGYVVANFSIRSPENYYWEITFDQEILPKLFGPYFGFAGKSFDVAESLYKHNWCYSCTGNNRRQKN